MSSKNSELIRVLSLISRVMVISGELHEGKRSNKGSKWRRGIPQILIALIDNENIVLPDSPYQYSLFRSLNGLYGVGLATVEARDDWSVYGLGAILKKDKPLARAVANILDGISGEDPDLQNKGHKHALHVVILLLKERDLDIKQIAGKIDGACEPSIKLTVEFLVKRGIITSSNAGYNLNPEWWQDVATV